LQLEMVVKPGRDSLWLDLVLSPRYLAGGQVPFYGIEVVRVDALAHRGAKAGQNGASGRAR